MTVLNGHIHQTMQKVEGNISFHTACSTAFPQPLPGAPDASPGPDESAGRQIARLAGHHRREPVRGSHTLAIVVDSTLQD